MRPGAIKIETRGSLWWIDETAHEYLRLPREEQPRERPGWGSSEAGPLEDMKWHPYESWEIVYISNIPFFLRIELGNGKFIQAPGPEILEGRS